jgi:hypothetical protein
MLRQIPYTCAKLAGYEIISDTLKNIIEEKDHKINLKKSSNILISDTKASSKILIQLGSGILAGIYMYIYINVHACIYKCICIYVCIDVCIHVSKYI